MDRDYIEALRQAYEAFLGNYRKSPVLSIDTNDLDFVRSSADREYVLGMVRAALEQGTIQQSLPELSQEAPPSGMRILHGGRRRLGDFQRFHRALDREKGFATDLSLNFAGLTEEVGEVGRELKIILEQARLLQAEDAGSGAVDRETVLERTLAARREVLAEEMSDVLAYLLKLANYAGIDLEGAYIDKMGRNWRRRWEPVPLPEGPR